MIERVKSVEGYNPWILKEFPEYEIEPWNEKFEYEGKKISIRDYDEATWQEKFKFEGEKLKLNYERIFDRLQQRGAWNDNRLERDLNRWRKRQQSK